MLRIVVLVAMAIWCRLSIVLVRDVCVFISSFRRVLYAVCNLLGCSPAYGV
jgi:hypothetical protein